MPSFLNNIGALSNSRQIESTQKKLNTTLLRLSTGSRINRAFEDAAGLQISNNLRADIRINNQAKINANNGLGLTAVADGTLEQANDLLSRAAEISIQAASGTTSQEGKDALNAEYQEILGQLDSLGINTKLDDKQVFGSSTDVRVGEETSESVSIDVANLSAADLGLGGSDLSSAAGASSALAGITAAIEQVSAERGNIGAKAQSLTNAINSLDTRNIATIEAESRIRDADIAQEVVNLTQAQILSQSSVASQAQSLKNQQGLLNLLQSN